MQKLAEALLCVNGIETAAHRAFASRCRIYDLDARIKALEAAIPPNQRTSSPELTKLHQELNAARAEYTASEAKLEALKARHAGAVALANLLAACVQARKDTRALEASIEAALNGQAAQAQKPAQKAPAQNTQAQVAGDGTETGTFKVLECRESKPGVVRAYCEGPEGKVAVYAKNGNAQTLAGAVGKQVQVKYRKGEKGLIALSVQLIQTKGLPDDRRIR